MPELYRSPSFYERLFSQRAHDVEFYRWLAEGQEELLELGAGTGRVSLPLLKDGLRVVALGVQRRPGVADLAEQAMVAPSRHAFCRHAVLA